MELILTKMRDGEICEVRCQKRFIGGACADDICIHIHLRSHVKLFVCPNSGK